MINRIKRLWLRLYFRMMPAHVLVEHRRKTLERLPAPKREPSCDEVHNRCDPSLPTLLRQHAD